MTPSTPVAAMSASQSARVRMFPLPSTGMRSEALTALITSQSARHALARFWSRVRP